MNPLTVCFTNLHRFTSDAFRQVDLAPADAITGADVLATTDAWGVFTHGTKALAGYLRRLQAGGLRAQGHPRIVAEGGAWATVDGDSSLGMVTSVFAMQIAITKARQQGIACVGVRNSCHFGAAGYYSWLAAREGLIGLSMANDIPSVAAPGSRGPVTGSNPISYAIPAGRHRPILLDMATATVALTPAAGHKGYGLALLIETLSGILSGAEFTWRVRSWTFDDPAVPTNHGAAFLAIDPGALMPLAQFTRRVEELVDEIHAAPRAEGVDRLYVPGEMEWERHDRSLKEGIRLPGDVVERLQSAAELTGLDLNISFPSKVQ